MSRSPSTRNEKGGRVTSRPGNEAAPLPDLNSPTEEPRTTSKASEPAKRAKLILRQKAGSAPFCWQRKAARKLIRKACDGASIGVYVLSVYDALTELASDAQVDAFRAGQPRIAEYAGCSVAQAKKCLSILGSIDLLKVESEGLKSWNTYTLLEGKTDGPEVANDSHCKAKFSNEGQNGAVAKDSCESKKTAVATVEEFTEESVEESPEEREESEEESIEKSVCRPAASRTGAGPNSSFSGFIARRDSLKDGIKKIIDCWPRADGNPEQQVKAVLNAVNDVGYPELEKSVTAWVAYYQALMDKGMEPHKVPGVQRFFGEKRYGESPPPAKEKMTSGLVMHSSEKF